MLRSAVVCLALAVPAAAQVAGFELDFRGPAAEGATFGDVGAYERLEGRVNLALDPGNPFNGRIVDLDLAPRNERGRVEATADLIVLQPVDPNKRRGTALIEVCNRGGRAALSYFDRGGRRLDRAADFGDGLLMRLGLTVVWVGWQQDVPRSPERLRLRGPTVARPDGSPITGPVRSDWVVDTRTHALALGHRDHIPFRPAEPLSERNTLTRRSGREAEREVVPREAWRFSEDLQAIEGDFEPGYIYELVYIARDPVVTGLGLAAIRDVASWLENGRDCPCSVERTIALGISQTGRFLRHMLWQGFVTDTEGRPTLDGVLAMTAGAGRGSFNHRFAQPSRDAHAYSAFFFPTDLFPFTSALQEDPVTGRFDGLFARSFDSDHLPKVFWINTGYEYWGRAAALIHVSVDGRRDVEPTARERIYHIASAQHYPGNARTNPIELRAIYRALLIAMLGWVEDGTAPPPSEYPKLDDGTLVPASRLDHVEIPGVVWPSTPHVAYRVDYGPFFWTRGVITVEPPRIGPAFPALVPQVDALGNEIGGVRPLELRVPVGTYLPWSLRKTAPGWPAAIADFVGRFVPLQRYESEREELGDARPSLSRLHDPEEYLDEVREAIRDLIRERWVLEEDEDFMFEHATRIWNLAARR